MGPYSEVEQLHNLDPGEVLFVLGLDVNHCFKHSSMANMSSALPISRLFWPQLKCWVVFRPIVDKRPP